MWSPPTFSTEIVHSTSARCSKNLRLGANSTACEKASRSLAVPPNSAECSPSLIARPNARDRTGYWGVLMRPMIFARLWRAHCGAAAMDEEGAVGFAEGARIERRVKHRSHRQPPFTHPGIPDLLSLSGNRMKRAIPVESSSASTPEAYLKARTRTAPCSMNRFLGRGGKAVDDRLSDIHRRRKGGKQVARPLSCVESTSGSVPGGRTKYPLASRTSSACSRAGTE